MATDTVRGMNCKVTIGVAGTTVLGIGSYSIPGVAWNELDDTSFGDVAEKILLGMKKFGTLTFKGNYKPGDTTGQAVLEAANLAGTLVTTLRFYYSAVSYWCADLTNDTGAGFYINPLTIDVAKDGLGAISFGARAVGLLAKV